MNKNTQTNTRANTRMVESLNDYIDRNFETRYNGNATALIEELTAEYFRTVASPRRRAAWERKTALEAKCREQISKEFERRRRAANRPSVSASTALFIAAQDERLTSDDYEQLVSKRHFHKTVEVLGEKVRLDVFDAARLAKRTARTGEMLDQIAQAVIDLLEGSQKRAA